MSARSDFITLTIPGGDEVWRDVYLYEGLYEVSNHARVRRLDSIIRAGASNALKTLPGHIMGPVNKGSRLPYYRLTAEGVTEEHSVGRLMWEAFGSRLPVGDGRKHRVVPHGGLWRPGEPLVLHCLLGLPSPVRRLKRLSEEIKAQVVEKRLAGATIYRIQHDLGLTWQQVNRILVKAGLEQKKNPPSTGPEGLEHQRPEVTQ